VKAAIAAVVAVVAVVAGLIYLARPKDSGPDPKAWDQKAAAAFKPLVNVVPDLVKGARDWQTGQLSDADFRTKVAAATGAFSRTQADVHNILPSPKVKAAGELYDQSASLYQQVGRIYEVMEPSSGDTRTQLDLMARRVRELADRVFDRGHAALAPYLDEQQSPDVEVRTPEEVPLWPEEGLAAGPPLDAAPGPPASSPPLRQQTRPQDSAAAWARAIRAAGIPPNGDLTKAIESQDRDHLADLARRYVAAGEKLRAVPDPKGQRDRSAILRLGLLVEADSARSAQLATYLDPASQGHLLVASRSLASIGNDLINETKP
jgi:hypothetical protein